MLEQIQVVLMLIGAGYLITFTDTVVRRFLLKQPHYSLNNITLMQMGYLPMIFMGLAGVVWNIFALTDIIWPLPFGNAIPFILFFCGTLLTYIIPIINLFYTPPLPPGYLIQGVEGIYEPGHVPPKQAKLNEVFSLDDTKFKVKKRLEQFPTFEYKVKGSYSLRPSALKQWLVEKDLMSSKEVKQHINDEAINLILDIEQVNEELARRTEMAEGMSDQKVQLTLSYHITDVPEQHLEGTIFRHLSYGPL